MNTHLMIDFETLGQKNDAKVLSLGAVLFNRDEILGEFYRAFDLEKQPGRSIQPDTVAWWHKQSLEARAIFEECKTGTDISLLPADFNKFVASYQVEIWSNGADFDIPILSHIYEYHDIKVPWKFWNHRCYRTVKALFNIEKKLPFDGVKHNALADAKYQAKCLSNFLREKENTKGE